MIFRIGNKVVGELKDGVFTKVVQYQKHHLHKYKVWAIDKEVVSELEKNNCTDIVIKQKNGKKFWTIGFDMFIGNGFSLNLGFGEQLACADINWIEKDAKQMEMFQGGTNG